MSTMKRASLPGADELFRPTKRTDPSPSPFPVTTVPESEEEQAPRQTTPAPSRSSRTRIGAPRRASGRQRHEEKITFYCTEDELLAIERSRLLLRELGVNADRGRIVREAVALALAELESRGERAGLAARLFGER